MYLHSATNDNDLKNKLIVDAFKKNWIPILL